MFKRSLCLAFALALTACNSEPAKEPESATPPPAPKPAVAELWNVTLGIDAPESTYVDPKTGDVYVSLIGGMPDQKDGNGRIAKISNNGRTTNATWADGMNAPKGLRSYEGTLWTADIDEILGFDMATGKLSTRVKVKDAKFLNDVATGPDGTVYVSDMMGNKIYTLKAGKLRIEPMDLIKYGLIPEFVGRLPVVGTLADLDKAALVEILTKPKNAIVKQYQKLFEYEGVKLRFDEPALEAIAELAQQRKVGARGLRVIIEELMLDLMYLLPSQRKIKEFAVTKDMVLSNGIDLSLLEKAG